MLNHPWSPMISKPSGVSRTTTFHRRHLLLLLSAARNKNSSDMLSDNSILRRSRFLIVSLLLLSLSCFLLYRASDSSPPSRFLFPFFPNNHHSQLDADIMWFRDPFPRFYLDADFQIACDHFSGSSFDLENRPNGGFNFVRSSNRSIEFYKFWYSSRETYPGCHDQDVLNNIKYDSFIIDIDLKMRFLNTAYFGGLCEPSKDFNKVCTMHANCCFGMDSKLHDLKLMLQDWKLYMALPPSLKRSSISSWSVPQNCSLHSLRHYSSPDKKGEERWEN